MPLSVVKLGPWRLPCCGGGYFRHFPLTYTLWALRRLEREGRSAVMYLHPYETELVLDKSYLRCHLGEKKLAQLRWELYLQCRNRAKTVKRLRHLLSTHRFASLARVFDLYSPMKAHLPANR